MSQQHPRLRFIVPVPLLVYGALAQRATEMLTPLTACELGDAAFDQWAIRNRLDALRRWRGQ